MLQKTIPMASALLGAALFASAPIAAGELPEPAQEAQPVNAEVWQQQIARDIPGFARFQGLPPMRFGLLVTDTGSVRSCMALPVTQEQRDRGQARGQALCESLVEHARFAPALDKDGEAIDSVYIADFGAARPLVAADYAGVRVN